MLFKINIYVKLALIALLIFGGIALSFPYGFGYTWIMILAGLLLLVSYFLLGTVQSTAELIQNQQFDEAEKRLSLTYFPNLLYVTNRAYYHMMKGSIAAQKKDMKVAEESFNKALTLNLPTDDERAMILLQMASIQLNRSNFTGAQQFLSQLKKLNPTQRIVKEQVDQLEKAVASRGNINLARSMGKQGMQMMRQSGGKRRRPPMR